VRAPSDDTRSGLIFGTSAYLLWGLFPLYWPLLEPAGTIEILAQRMVWSFVVMVLLLRFTGGFGGVRRILADRRQRTFLVAAALLVSFNWGTYIYGVNTKHVVETSLGYFINPLFTIMLGVIVLREQLRRLQWVAVGIGAAAVAVIAVDYGRPPWIALVLAVSFGLYGFSKKQAAAPAADSLFVETGVQLVPAMVALAVLGGRGELEFGRQASTSALLAGAGVITVVPLLLFAASTRRLPLSLLGLLQYLTPVVQFAIGVGVRHEKLPSAEWVGFVMVWVALIVLTYDGLRTQRTAARLAAAAESVAA
jgi:chloramphenicol-sensitive protein RarD